MDHQKRNFSPYGVVNAVPVSLQWQASWERNEIIYRNRLHMQTSSRKCENGGFSYRCILHASPVDEQPVHSV